MVLPLAVYYGLQARKNGRRVWPWWASCLLLGAAMFFSLSRSAMLGLAAAGIPLFLTWSARRRLAAIGTALVFLVVMRLAVPGLLGTILGLFTFFNEDTSVSYRTHDYPVVISQFLDHPLLGRGLGTWYAPKHQVFDNQYLLSLVEIGIVGLVGFCSVFGVAVYAAIRTRRAAADQDGRDLATALLAAVMVPLVGSFTFDLTLFGVVTGLTFVLFGSVGALLRAATGESPRGDRAPLAVGR
jgi:O-antigen ligase